MTILVWAECADGRLRKTSLAAVGGASGLGPVTMVLAGPAPEAAVEQAASLDGVSEVIVAAAAPGNSLDDAGLAAMLAQLVTQCAATHCFAASSPAVRGILPRLCALLDVMQLSDVVRIDSADTFSRPMYAGSALATLRSTDTVKVASLRASAFAAPSSGSVRAPVRQLSFDLPVSSVKLCAIEPRQGDHVDLAEARVVVSGGRGMGSAEQYAWLVPLARSLGAALGASRAAVDAGYAPPENQVGQTGRIVAPELYLAFGISGAVQHWAGMKDSRFVIAVNRDPEAPIFQFADVGLVADLFDVLPVLKRELGCVL